LSSDDRGRLVVTYLGRGVVIIIATLIGVGVLGFDFLGKIRHF
jgi:hypothetical protein